MQKAEPETLARLFPSPGTECVPLRGLYLKEPFAPPEQRSQSFVYANFITSLDGRISLPDARTRKSAVPSAIANARDWRLFQELAAGADALIVSGRYVRGLTHNISTRSFPISGKSEYADLHRWRRVRGLTPQPAIVIVTASLNLPRLDALTESGRSVYVATGEAADPRKIASLKSQGARVLQVGDGSRIQGGRLIGALAQEAHWNIAMIGGGEVLNTLIVADAMDRLYLTLACRMLGGLSFDTLLRGPVLTEAADFRLKALHYDAQREKESNVEQLFVILDRGAPHQRQMVTEAGRYGTTGE